MTLPRHGSTSRSRSRHRPPIFSDPGHHREVRLKASALTVIFVLFAWLAAFAIGLYRYDLLPQSERLAIIGQPLAGKDAPAQAPTAAGCTAAAVGPDPAPGQAESPVAAYVRVWPEGALASLASHCSAISGIFAEWLEVDPETQTVTSLDDLESDGLLAEFRQERPTLGLTLVAVLPLAEIEAHGAGALDDAAAKARLAGALSSAVAERNATRLCLYPEVDDHSGSDTIRGLLVELRSALPPGTETCLVAEAESELWREPGLSEAVDHVLLMGFGRPTAGDGPGPLAAQTWFLSLVQEASALIPAGKLDLALGSFGYLWRGDGSPPEPVSYAEAMRLAATQGGEIALDPASLNTHITFPEQDGARREIWLLDAASAHNQLLALDDLRPAGLVIWSAGLEDPGIWPLIETRPALPPVAEVEAIAPPEFVGYEGTGPFRRIVDLPEAGRRSFEVDADTGLITGEAYSAIPRPFTVERYGALDRKAVALTFDDGPDPAFTPGLLAALRAKGVPATFFLVGANMIRFPDIVRQMIAEGHEVGSHTFFHPEDRELAVERVHLELNAVQRLLSAITGRTTYLFRTPYGRSAGPLTSDEAEVQLRIQNEGYLVAGADVVPRDWEGMTAQEIVADVLDHLDDNGGQVIVMHDAGGDRAATVAAVPLLVDALRARGYDFVTLSAFLGLSTDDVMPYARDGFSVVDGAVFIVVTWFGWALTWLFWLAVAYGLVRSLLVLTLALLRRKHAAPDFAPPVTVLVPAFNEEFVIVDAVRSILASDYPDLRVIVIDDGSADRTSEAVTQAFALEPRVRLLRQQNGGKWSALNAAYRKLQTEFVVAVDADTILEPDAIRLMMRHFADPKVGAVAGNVQIVNRKGLLPRLQTLEYVTAQNIDRRAQEFLGAVMVVPGAIGAWRAGAVWRAGLYSPMTITEDADLTVSVRRAGYRVVFEERARSRTEVPDTVPAFLKQRLRWSFGMMQTAWKHRHAGRSAPGIAFFSIPDLWLTGVGLGLLAPIADAVFFGVLFRALADPATGVPPLAGEAQFGVLVGWLALPLVDLLALLVAFGFERSRHWPLVLLVPLQRLLYRPLLYVTVYRAVGRALAGHLATWGKLDRRGLSPGPKL